jgi:hypothetical protein
MTITCESSGTGPDRQPAPMLPQTQTIAEVRVQPVPSVAARIVSTGEQGIAQDRRRLWSMYGRRYRQAMEAVAALVPELQGPRSNLRKDRVDALADLAAVHLYLTEEWGWLDEAVLEGTVGVHLPLARCIAAGLRRLPSYRGPAALPSNAVGMVTDWYCDNRFVVDQGFWTASTSTAALTENGPGFLVWSLNGRRTGTIDPDAPERLVFPPGTRFKILQVDEGRRTIVFMRELFPPEPTAHSPAASCSDRTGWLDKSTVEELEHAVSEPSVQAADIMRPRGRLPGLIITKNGTVKRSV